MADDGEAESAALLIATETVVDAIEAFEDAPALAARDARPFILNRERHLAVLAPADEADVFGLAILVGILQEIEERLRDHLGVGEDHGQILWQIGGELNVLA